MSTLIWDVHYIMKSIFNKSLIHDLHRGKKDIYLDPNFIRQSPTVALGQAKEEILQMGLCAVMGLKEASLYITTSKLKYRDTSKQVQVRLLDWSKKITEYLLQLKRTSLSARHSHEQAHLINMVQQLNTTVNLYQEMIGMVEERPKHQKVLTNQHVLDLTELTTIVTQTLQLALQSFDFKDRELAFKAVAKKEWFLERKVNILKQHERKLVKGNGKASSSSLFIELIERLEKVIEHAVNIARSVLSLPY